MSAQVFHVRPCSVDGCTKLHGISVVPALRSGRSDSNGTRAVGVVGSVLTGAPARGDSTPPSRGGGLDTRHSPARLPGRRSGRPGSVPSGT